MCCAIDDELNTRSPYLISILLEVDLRHQRMKLERQIWTMRVGLIVLSCSIAASIMSRIDGAELIEAANGTASPRILCFFVTRIAHRLGPNVLHGRDIGLRKANLCLLTHILPLSPANLHESVHPCLSAPCSSTCYPDPSPTSRSRGDTSRTSYKTAKSHPNPTPDSPAQPNYPDPGATPC